MRRTPHQTGMTLIEVMIVVVILGGLMALVLPSVQALAGVRVKEAAGRLAGTMGYLYSHAAMTGRTCRLVFQVGEEEGSYEVQCTEEAPRLAAGTLDVREGQVDRGEPEEPARADEESDSDRIKRQASWAQFDGKALGKGKLGAGVQVAGYWTPRHRDVVEAGEAYLYFFPQGETQPAYVWLRDRSENWFTLTVQPLTGKVTVHAENLEVPQ